MKWKDNSIYYERNVRADNTNNLFRWDFFLLFFPSSPSIVNLILLLVFRTGTDVYFVYQTMNIVWLRRSDMVHQYVISYTWVFFFFCVDKSDKIRKREIDPVTVQIKYYLRCEFKNLITVSGTWTLKVKITTNPNKGKWQMLFSLKANLRSLTRSNGGLKFWLSA